MKYYKIDTKKGTKIIKRKHTIKSTEMASLIVGEEVKKITVLNLFDYWRLKKFF